MTKSQRFPESQTFFSKFLSIIGLLAAALFFAGWIYRWAYYAYFQLNLATLQLSPQSYLIVPIQIFLGTPQELLKTLGVLFLTILAIYFTLWILRRLEIPAERKLEADDYHQDFSQRISTRSRQSWIKRQWQVLSRSNPLKKSSFALLESFINELVVIAWILIVLFYFAQARGIADARRDAYHCTSTLPAVAFISPLEKLPYGRVVDNPDTLADAENFGILGDWQLFDDMLGRERNDVDPESPTHRVWRLLLEQSNWIYFFPALPPNAEPNLYPPVIGIQQSSGDQLILLRPEVAGDECSSP
jgi:hypothetical protein